MVKCPMSGELAAVRKDKRGAFYLIGVAGRLAPSTDFGQDWFLEHATIWGDGEPPTNCPDWIRQGKSFPPLTRSRVRHARQHSSTPRVVEGDTGGGIIQPPPVEPSPPPARPARERNPFMMFGADDDA
jgi:hypothetical protein